LNFKHTGGNLKISTAFFGRYLMLIPVAFCLYLVLDSQDKNVRLAAVIGLLILSQLREWLLISAMKLPQGKNGVGKEAQAIKSNKS
jgi:hypothetical protein